MRLRFYQYAGGGGLLWAARVGLAAYRGELAATFVAVELLLELGMLVKVPLLLGVLAEKNRRGRYALPWRLAVVLYPFCVVAAVLAAPWSPLPGLAWSAAGRGLLTLPYLAFTLLLALFGAARFLERGRGLPGPLRPAETAVDAGLVYIAVGGGWLLLDRIGLRPMDFPAIIVLLTAVHFHFAGFALPILAGLLGRRRAEHAREEGRVGPDPGDRLYAPVAGIVIAGPILVALGITFSPLVEVITALVLACGVVGFAFLQAMGVRAAGPVPVRALFLISSAALATAMCFAVLFAWGEYSGRVIVAIPEMVLPHGLANAVAVLAAVLAYVLRPPVCSLPPAGIPFSRLRSGGRIGPDFLARRGLLVERSPRPRGLADDLGVYRYARLAPERLAPVLRDFYERTEDFELLVRPRWRPGFRTAAWFYKCFSAYMGQMNFPRGSDERKMDSRIQAVDDARDGRVNVRAWTRCYEATGRPLYVATYAHHRQGGETFMNIAFPLPGGNLTSILRLEELPDAGLLLTTLPRSGRTDAVGDEGVYYATPLLPIRLPMNESILVRSAAAPGQAPLATELGRALGAERPADLLARHDMWLFGIPFLSLDYYIYSLR